MFRHKCIRNIRTFKLQHNVRSTIILKLPEQLWRVPIRQTEYETLCIQQNIVKAQTESE